MREHYFTFFHWFVFSCESSSWISFLIRPAITTSLAYLYDNTRQASGHYLPEVRLDALFGPIGEPFPHFYRLMLKTHAHPSKKALVLTDMNLIRASFRFILHRCYVQTREKTCAELFVAQYTISSAQRQAVTILHDFLPVLRYLLD